MQWPTLLPALTCTWSFKSSNNMRHIKFILVFFIFSFSTITYAGDAAHKACTGTISDNSEDVSLLKKITITYDDVRASDGEQRKYTLSIVHKGKNYSGTTTSAEATVGIKIINKENPSDILFEGTFKPLENNGLELKGKSFLQGETQQPFSAVLECGDIVK